MTLTNGSFWILTKFYNLEKTLNSNLETYELAHNISAIYEFLWDDLADWYIEYLKTCDKVELSFARELFRQFVILASPYCPFECEALWKQFFGESELLAATIRDGDWSSKAFSIYFGLNNLEALDKDSRFQQFQSVIDFITNIRSLKGLFAIDPVTNVEIFSTSEILESYSDYIKLLSKSVVIAQSKPELYTVTTPQFSYQIDILQYIKDKPTEIARTNKIIDSLNKQITALEAQLSNEKFVNNAEPEVIETKKSDLNLRQLELQQQLDKIEFLEK
jgi:valyl-tRNA synthetase